MNVEMKVKRLLDEHDDKLKALNNSYWIKFDGLAVNQFGETDADAVLELNMWFVETENKIKNEFVEAIMNLGKEEESGQTGNADKT